MRQIAITDIHGYARTFRRLLFHEVQLGQTDQLFLLGDYVDRGPRSREVLDLILELKAQGYQVTCLEGNHEAMMRDAYTGDTDERFLWIINGGAATLASFEAQTPDDIPAGYWNFLASLRLYAEVPGYLLVHAGLDCRQPHPLADRKSILWIRNWYEHLDRAWLGDRIILHGHTPQQSNLIEAQAAQLDILPVLNLDAGCHRHKVLCAFDMTHRKLYFQPAID